MSEKFKKLAQAALAIPGMVTMAEASVPTESELAYRYSYYSEDDSPAERDDSGTASERYKIHVHQLHYIQPLPENYALQIDSSFEYMAGASPVYSYVPEGSEQVYTHFSGASRELRFDLSASGRKYFSKGDAGLNGYFSKERDYFALSAGTDGSFQINEQMTTLSGGLSAGYDWINPNSSIPDGKGGILMGNDLNAEQEELLALYAPARYSAIGRTKWQLSAYEGVGQIIDMNTVVQFSASVTYKEGYLSDYYRDCGNALDPIVMGVPCDIRPSSRLSGTLSAGLRHFLVEYDSAIHADYRLYFDSWDVLSHTLSLDYIQNWVPPYSFLQNWNAKLQIIPGMRYYMQSASYFYEVPFVSESDGANYDAQTSKYYSSDPRLSHYGAISFSLKTKLFVQKFSVDTVLERYVSHPGYGFNFEDETPGLVSFWRISTGLGFRF